MEQILKNLQTRYAVKLFENDFDLTDQQYSFIEEVLRLSPSSDGVQPWKFLVIKNKDIRKELQAAAYGQAQILDASAIILLCARMDLENCINEYVAVSKEIRNLSEEKAAGFRGYLDHVLKTQNSEEKIYNYSSNQCYIALGNLVSACAEAHIDVCPMGGFDHLKFDEILNLKDKHLRSVAICAVGKANENDPARANPKVRFARSQVVENI